MSNKPLKLNLMRRTTNFSSSSNQPAKSAQSSYVMLNVESMGMDQYCLFRQEYHSEKTCSQWNHNMNALAAHIIDTMISDEKAEPAEEKEENVVAEETEKVKHAVNTLSCVFTAEKKSVKE